MGSGKRVNLFKKLINKLFHKNKKSVEKDSYIADIKTYTYSDNKEGLEKLERFTEILDILEADYSVYHNVPGGFYNVYVRTVRKV